MIISDLHSALLQHINDVPAGQVFILTDTHTAHYCLPTIADSIGEKTYHNLTIAAGENHKNLATLQNVWDFLFSHHATRQALLINLGGGMITDLGGLAAATYMRSIRCINIPTTLLAMVDASSGGKTGINYQGRKNAIGTFTQPAATLIYLPFLKTLPATEWLSGYAEMLKHALLDTETHWKQLLQIDINTDKEPISSEILSANLSIKERIVNEDPTEKGWRKTLNFGHTIGHAIEEAYTEKGQSVAHGYCVLWGMVAEVYLSVVHAGCPRDILTSLTHLMTRYYGRPVCNCKQREELIHRMYHDKKNEANSSPNFTLLRDIGQPIINQHLSDENINEALEYLFSV